MGESDEDIFQEIRRRFTGLPGDALYFEDCQQPGWAEGPLVNGGEPDGWFCERRADHEGPHAWLVESSRIVTWPVK